MVFNVKFSNIVPSIPTSATDQVVGVRAGTIDTLYPLSNIRNGVVNVADFGAVGDGVTDDAPAINAASAYAVANGITKIIFPAGKTFRITSNHILPRQNLIWDGQGSTVVTGVGYPTIKLGIFGNEADSSKTLIGTVTGTGVTAPTNQLTLSTVTGLAVGNWIAVKLGFDPYDNTEPFYTFVAQVTAINSNTITFDWMIDQSVNFNAYTYNQKDPNAAAGGGISVPGSAFNSVYLLTTDFALNLTFRDFVLIGDSNGNIEGGISFQWGANIRCENIIGNPGGTGDMGAGLIQMQYCRNIRIENAYLGCNSNTSAQGSKGRMYTFPSCFDVVDSGHFSKDCKNSIAFCEDYCEKITFINPVDVINNATVTAGFIGYGFNGRANGELINPTVNSNIPSATATWIYVGTAGSDGDYRISGTLKWRGLLANTVLLNISKMDCVFDYDDPNIGYARIDFFNKNRVAFRVPLFPSMSVTYSFPGGISDIDIIASANVNVSTVTTLDIIAGSFGFVDVHTSLVAGKVVNVAGVGLPRNGFASLGGAYGGIAGFTSTVSNISIVTSASAQTDGNFLGFVARVPRILEANLGIFGPSTSLNYSLVDDSLCAMLDGTPQRIVESGLTVASLPAAAASNNGMRRLVTDATVTTFASIVAGSGANTVPVYSDGTNWRIG
jgi:hypothetical protein